MLVHVIVSVCAVVAGQADASPPEPTPQNSQVGSQEASTGQHGSVAVLPIKLEKGGSAQAAPLLAGALAVELESLAGAKVITAEEVGALVQAETDRQGFGAVDDGALQEIVGALGAQRVVVGELKRVGKTHIWHASMVRHSDAVTLAETEVKARTLDALTAQVPEVALSLVGRADEVTLKGAAARKRLGFEDEKDLASFKKYRTANADMTTTEALTTFIKSHNLESNRLAVAEGVVLGLASALSAAALVLIITPFLMAVTFRVGFVWLPFILVGILALPASLTMAIVGLVLVGVDMLNRGTVSVRSDGCCRDDADLYDAEQNSSLRRVAALAIALMGPLPGVIALVFLQFAFVVTTVAPELGIGRRSGEATEEFLRPDLQATITLAGCAYPLAGLCCASSCAGIPVGLGLLLWPDRSLVDEVDAPQKKAEKPAAGKAP